MSEERILVSVIIPVYNRLDDIKRCIQSLQCSTMREFEIIVVDNCSTENIKEYVDTIAENDSSICCIRLNKNLMAAGGRNAGIAKARGKYLLFVDSDNIVAPDMIELLVEAMENDETIGMIGPVMLYYRKPSMVWFAGNDINLFTSRTIYWQHNKDISDLKRTGIYETHHLPNLMMVRKAVQQKIGLFDESYYIMYEEADYAMRVRNAGYKIMVCRDAITYHNCFLPEEVVDNEMRKLGCDNPERTFHFSKNRGIFIRKYAPWYGRIAYMIFFRFLFAAYYCGTALKNGRKDIAKAWWKGTFYKENMM